MPRHATYINTSPLPRETANVIHFATIDLSTKQWNRLVLETVITPSSFTPLLAGKELVINYSFANSDFLTIEDLESKATHRFIVDHVDGGTYTSPPIEITGNFIYTWYSLIDSVTHDTSYDNDPWTIATEGLEVTGDGDSSEINGIVEIGLSAGSLGTYCALNLEFESPFDFDYSFIYTFHPVDENSGTLTLVKSNKTLAGIQLLFTPTPGSNGIVGNLHWRATSKIFVPSGQGVIANSTTDFMEYIADPAILNYEATAAGTAAYNRTYVYTGLERHYTLSGSDFPVYIYTSDNSSHRLAIGVYEMFAAFDDGAGHVAYTTNTNSVTLAYLWTYSSGAVAPGPTVTGP